jgi:hypothetical protein
MATPTAAPLLQPTVAALQAHAALSIERAERHLSKLDRAAFQARGFTSPKVRHLLNNLGGFPGLHYLEIGVHRGATFVAANYRNRLASATAIDNWSEFAEDGEVKDDFLRHTSALLKAGSYRFLEQDCFTVGEAQLPAPVNFYLYDGEHSHESQRQALTHYYPMLDDTFLFVVDDYTWESARTGTQEAIAELDLTVRFEQELVDGWWNGLYVSVLQK